MKLHSLRYFAVLAEELHFGRAAERLAITQPPLSGAIKSLEDELGVRLFERDSKHVQLTAAGEAFLAEVNQILERVARAEQVVKAVAVGLRGTLEVGVTGSLVYRDVPAIVQHFGRSVPGVEVMLREMSSAEQVAALLRGQLHAGFLNASAVPPQLTSLPLPSDHFVCCLPAGHPQAQAAEIDLATLAGERFVMFSREVAPANHDNVIAIFSRAGIHPHTVHATRQWLTVIGMIANGLGVSLVPSSLARTQVAGVVFVPLRGEPAHSPALLAWNPLQVSPALASLVECTREVLAQGLRSDADAIS